MSHPWEVSYHIARKMGLSKSQIKSVNKQNKQQYIISAWHEAAHSLVGRLLGIPTEFIDLTPRITDFDKEKGISLSAAQIKQPTPTKDTRKQARNGDIVAMHSVEAHVTTIMAGVVFDLGMRQFGGGLDLIVAIQTAMSVFNADEEKCNEFIRKCAIEAATLLDFNRHNLKAVAEACIKSQMITGTELECVKLLPAKGPAVGFIKYADIHVLFDIGEGISPRYQLGLIGIDEPSDRLTVYAEPPYEFIFRMDETMLDEVMG